MVNKYKYIGVYNNETKKRKKAGRGATGQRKGEGRIRSNDGGNERK